MTTKKTKEQRRKDKKAKRAKKTHPAGSASPAEGGVLTLHYEPAGFPVVYTSMLMAQLSHAYELASKMPDVTWPVHVELKFGGRRVCGAVEPGEGGVHISPDGEVPPTTAEA